MPPKGLASGSGALQLVKHKRSPADECAPKGLIGPVSREAHAAELVWRFFASTRAAP